MNPGKTFSIWMGSRTWCMQNPTKLAAIIIPEGVFEIKFIPNENREQPIGNYEWFKALFTEDV